MSGASLCSTIGVSATADRAVLKAGPSFTIAKELRRLRIDGPLIVVGELDHRNVKRGNTDQRRRCRQSYNTKEMIGPSARSSNISRRIFTFVPGDVIAGGTSAGTAADIRDGRPKPRKRRIFPQDRRRGGTLIAADRKAWDRIVPAR